MYNIGHYGASHFSVYFSLGSIIHTLVKLNTRGYRFAGITATPHPLPCLWITVWITCCPVDNLFIENKGDGCTFGTPRHITIICPLINLYSTLRHSIVNCLPCYVLLSYPSVTRYPCKIVELSTVGMSHPDSKARPCLPFNLYILRIHSGKRYQTVIK